LRSIDPPQTAAVSGMNEYLTEADLGAAGIIFFNYIADAVVRPHMTGSDAANGFPISGSTSEASPPASGCLTAPLDLQMLNNGQLQQAVSRFFGRLSRLLPGFHSAPTAPIPVPAAPMDRLHLERLSELLRRADR
jgi:hypothetical protein